MLRWLRLFAFASARFEAFALLFDLQGFPIAQDLRRGIGLDVAEDVRMAIHELARKSVEDIIDSELPLLPGHFCIKKHLQKQIAQFTRKLIPIPVIDCLKHLVALFQGIALGGIEGLFAVPGTASWRTQAGHDRNRALEPFSGGSWHR